MSEASKAVFLSYASQDTAAAQRICDALRAAGIEVWFDQNELVGGDQWDAKIRGQISSCALFMPVISANTQARLEGYFRLEWKVAAQRSHTMADERVFLLPVVLDDTRDAAARVPVEFRAVQWTKLPGGTTPAAFVARVQRLLAGDGARALRSTPAESAGSGKVALPARFKGWWALPIVGVVVALILVVKGPRPTKETGPANPPAAATSASGMGEATSAASSPTEPRGRAANVSTKTDEKSVAVLAFANLSDDKANEYFSDGISEELLNVLAKVPKLKVAARTSSFYFKGRNEPIPDIARQLGVAYVVEGSVRKAGNKVRITAQLIKAADGFHVWSETYDRDLTDIFAVQDEIAKKILGIVKGSLMGDGEQPHATTTKIEAYTLFLQGQGAFARRGVAGLQEAIRLYEAALEIDPDYVPALVGAAQARLLVPIYANLSGAKAAAMIASARAAAKRVLEIDPRNATAHVVSGWSAVQYDWRWHDGITEMLQARELAPNDAWVWNSLGDAYRYVGNLQEALAAKRREWELDPLSAVSHWDLAYTHQVAGDYEHTMHWAERAMTLAPHNLDSYMPAILIAAQTGRLEKMREVLTAARREVHENEGMLLLLEARGAIAERQPAAARRILAQVEPLVESGDSTPGYLGYMYLLLGESAQAARWLQRGYESHDATLVWPENIDFEVIARDPATRPLLDRPGLKELYELRQRNARVGLDKL